MKSIFTKLLIVSILSSLTFTSIFAQTAAIGGSITDSDSGEPLIGATIKSGSTGVVTDYNGAYEFKIPEGSHEITVDFIGYETVSKSITLKSGETLQLDFQLKEQSTILQTATVTSGKFEKPLGEVTVSMEVIKPRLLEAINSTSVSDGLGKVPGLSIIGGQANIRGGSGWSYGAGSRVLLLVDDIPILQADAGRPNWNDYPVENVDQIEVVKGAASALYGSSAMNGIINIRTGYAKAKTETKISTFYTSVRDPKNKEMIWYDAQPFSTGLTFSHKQKFKKLDFVVSGLGVYSNSFREDTWSRYGRLTTNLRYRIKENLAVGVNVNYNRRKSSSYFYWKDWGDDALRGDSTSFGNSKPTRVNIDPFITYFDDKGNRHKFISRIYLIDNNNDNNQSNQSQLYYGEYQYQKRFEDIDLVTTAGLVGIHTGVQAAIYGDTTYTTSNLAGYLQFDKKLFEKLNISGGMRYERNTINSPEIVRGDTIPNGKSVEAKPVFRLGLNYQLGAATFIRTSWGQGYRFPTIAEKFVSTSAGAINVFPNPNLESETGWTAEVGIKQGVKIKNWSGYFDAAAFWSEYDNMMEFTFFSFAGFRSENVGNTVIKGLDLSFAGEGKFDDITLYVLAGYTYVDPKFKEFDETGNDVTIDIETEGQANARSSSADHNVLKYRNKHSAKLDVEAQYKKFSLGLAGTYSSHMEAVDFVFEEAIPGIKDHRTSDTNGSKVFDVRTAYQITKEGKISLIVKNIFNEVYVSRPAILESPRNVTLRLDYKF